MIRYISEDLLTENIRGSSDLVNPQILWILRSYSIYNLLIKYDQLWTFSDNIYKAILKSVIQILQKTSDDPHILWT